MEERVTVPHKMFGSCRDPGIQGACLGKAHEGVAVWAGQTPIQVEDNNGSSRVQANGGNVSKYAPYSFKT
jgi:hypothetical protein